MNETLKRYDEGVIHGRFQVLYHDHLKYLLAGKALCRHLVVGITNPDEKGISSSDVRRRMADGLPWEHLVPGTVALLLKEWGIPQRIRSMRSSG